MFDYYKWRLANKPANASGIKINEKEPLKQRVWLAMSVFVLAITLTNSFATFWRLPVVVISLVVTGVVFIWLVLELLNVTIKKIRLKLLKVLGFLVGAGLLWGLVFGIVNWLAHLLFGNIRHHGQITNFVEMLMWICLLLVAPVMIVVFFRFMDRRKITDKIHPQIYFELVITLVIGAVLTYFPNQIILNTLLVTRLVQFLLLTIINTALIAGLITTCHNRGVL